MAVLCYFFFAVWLTRVWNMSRGHFFVSCVDEGSNETARANRTHAEVIEALENDRASTVKRVLGTLTHEQASAIGQALRGNTSLESLVLQNCGITDQSVACIAQGLLNHRSITILDLADNHITDCGARYIADVLDRHPSLAVLDLTRNYIADDGAQDIATRLPLNTRLHTLHLSHNRIAYCGAEMLAEALRHNTSLLSLNAYGNLFDESAARLFAVALEHNATIRWVAVDDEQPNLLLARLTTPHQRSDAIREMQATEWYAQRMLHERNLLNVTASTKVLYLWRNNVTDMTLGPGITLDEMRRIAHALRHNGSVEKLRVQLRESTYTPDCAVRELSAALHGNHVLRKLFIDDSGVRCDGATHLAAALKHNETLHLLSLRNNHIGDRGLKQLAGALESNAGLTTLDLQGNPLGDDGLQRLAVSLQYNRALRCCFLSDPIDPQLRQYISFLMDTDNDSKRDRGRTHARNRLVSTTAAQPQQQSLPLHWRGLLEQMATIRAHRSAIEHNSLLSAFEETSPIRARLELFRETDGVFADDSGVQAFTRLATSSLSQLRGWPVEGGRNVIGRWVCDVVCHYAVLDGNLAELNGKMKRHYRLVADQFSLSDDPGDASQPRPADEELFAGRCKELLSSMHLQRGLLEGFPVDELEQAVERLFGDEKPATDSKADGVGSCVICKEHAACYIVQPCYHLCYCAECFGRDERNARCPVCGQAARKKRRIYVP